MIHLIKTAFAVILAVLLTLGAVYNRQGIDISTGPFSESVTVPLYVAMYGGLAIGFFFGVLYGWLHYGPIGRWSKSMKKKKKENAKNKTNSHESADQYDRANKKSDERSDNSRDKRDEDGAANNQTPRDLTLSGWEKP